MVGIRKPNHLFIELDYSRVIELFESTEMFKPVMITDMKNFFESEQISDTDSLKKALDGKVIFARTAHDALDLRRNNTIILLLIDKDKIKEFYTDPYTGDGVHRIVLDSKNYNKFMVGSIYQLLKMVKKFL